MPGALALAAGASTAHAATVQISFGDRIATSSIDSFNPDLTGDGFQDLRLGRSTGESNPGMTSVNFDSMVGYRLLARAAKGATSASLTVGSVSVFTVGDSLNLRSLVPITFRDAAINGNQITSGWLDLSASAGMDRDAEIRVIRLIFDDEATAAPTGVSFGDAAYPEFGVSAVPEPGQNLGLLALGAGGLLLRRRSKRAA